MSVPPSIGVGSILGQYQLTELIAVGGMGHVYRAYEASLDRNVAIKILAPELACDPETAARFLTEARAAATLNHPNVVHVYSAGQINGTFYFAMELVEGTHLEALLAQQRQLNVREAVEFARQAALGLHHAHEHGLIHGDVKPANFLVNNSGTIKVTDFGLVRQTRADKKSARVENAFGTPSYVSPEVIEGKPSDHRSDIYSLGATLFHMLAGRPPFIGATQEETLQHHLHKPIPSLLHFNGRVVPVLDQLVARMLAKAPGARFQTYPEVIHALERFLEDRPLGGRAPGSAPAKPDPTAKMAGTKPAESKLGLAFTLVSVVACGLILFLVYKMQTAGNHRPPQPAPASANPPAKPPHPPQPPPPAKPVTAADEREQLATRELDALRPEATAALNNDQIGRAYTLYGQFPHDRFAGTAAAETVATERATLRKTAEAKWLAAAVEIETLRAANRHEDALAVCDRLTSVCDGLPDLVETIRAARRLLIDGRDELAAKTALDQAAHERNRATQLAEWNTQLDTLVTGFQWDKGQQQFAQADPGPDPALKKALTDIQTEWQCLTALRKGVADRLAHKPSPPATLTTKRGDIKAQIAGLTPEGIIARQELGASGFAETTIPWSDFTPASISRIYWQCLDQTNADEVFGYTMLLTHQALIKQARIEDARRTLQAVAQRDPARAPIIEPYLARLLELELKQSQSAANQQAEADAAKVWTQLQSAVALNQWDRAITAVQLLTTDYTRTDFVKAKARDLEQINALLAERGAPRAGIPFSLTGLANANFILGEGETTDRGFEGKSAFATQAHLGAGVGVNGLPNDGALDIPNADPPAKFQLLTAPGNDTIALGPRGSVYGKEITLPLPATQQRRYSHIYFLLAGTSPSMIGRITFNYESGITDSTRIRIPSWTNPDPPQDTAVAATLTRSTGEKEDVRLFSQTHNPDSDRKLRSITLSYISTASAGPDAVVGIFAITGIPAETKR